MREFFRGWMRKVGCVTLGLACVVCGLWIRSHVSCDIVAFPLQGRQHTIITIKDAACWIAMATDEGEWGCELDAEIGYAEFAIEEMSKELGAHPHLRFRRLFIPYWSLTMPLTLLSAFLLLWKSRKREGHQISKDKSN